MGTEERIEELRNLRDEALHSGSERAVARRVWATVERLRNNPPSAARPG